MTAQLAVPAPPFNAARTRAFRARRSQAAVRALLARHQPGLAAVLAYAASGPCGPRCTAVRRPE